MPHEYQCGTENEGGGVQGLNPRLGKLFEDAKFEKV